MRAYLITTGILFALVTLLHVWRAVGERMFLMTNPWEFLGVAGIGLLTAALSVWAWRLLRTSPRT